MPSKIKVDQIETTSGTGSIYLNNPLNLPTYTTANRPGAGVAVAGQIIYNTDDKVVQVFDGTNWNAAGQSGATDGSSATKAALSPTALRQAGVTSNGVYWFKTATGTTYQAYALMDTSSFDNSSGGWILAFNYNAVDGSASLGGVPWYGNTTFWLGQNEQNQTQASPWSYNVKTRAYDLYNFSSILFVIHKRNGFQPNSTYLRGWSIYNNTNFANNSIQAILNGGNDRVVSSGGRTNSQNYVGNLSWNSRRSDQPRAGDPFIDGTVNGYNNGTDNLVFNTSSSYIWGASQNLTRITTTAASTTSRGHTVAGLGIQHTFSSWGSQLAWAPISAYCDTPAYYGTTATVGSNNFNGGSEPNGQGYGMWSHNAPNGCTNGWADGAIDAGISVFVR